MSGPEAADVESLKLEVSELRTKCEQLQEENAELKNKVSFHTQTKLITTRSLFSNSFIASSNFNSLE